MLNKAELKLVYDKLIVIRIMQMPEWSRHGPFTGMHASILLKVTPALTRPVPGIIPGQIG